jgi:plasmid stability protein
MSGLVQIRDVPDDVRRTLKSRAALAGTSLSEYLRAELARVAERPTPDELWERLRSRDAVEAEETSAEAVRLLRDHGE